MRKARPRDDVGWAGLIRLVALFFSIVGTVAAGIGVLTYARRDVTSENAAATKVVSTKRLTGVVVAAVVIGFLMTGMDAEVESLVAGAILTMLAIFVLYVARLRRRRRRVVAAVTLAPRDVSIKR